MEIEVIQDLIKMDEETRNKINNAHELKYKLKQAIDQEKKKLTDEAWANVETQVKSMREEIRTTHEKKQAEAKAMYEKESKRIIDTFNANKERWIQMIADYTVGKREQE
jgi:hypothetical protein